MLSIFSCACWPFVCLLWRNVYLGQEDQFRNQYIGKTKLYFLYFLSSLGRENFLLSMKVSEKHKEYNGSNIF